MLDPLEILSDARGRALIHTDNEIVGAFAWRILMNAGDHIAGRKVYHSLPENVYVGMSGWSESNDFLEAARAREQQCGSEDPEDDSAPVAEAETEAETCARCGGSLVHIAGRNLQAVICPVCDADSTAFEEGF